MIRALKRIILFPIGAPYRDPVTEAASRLGKRGAEARRQNDRRRVCSKAQQMLAEMGLPPDNRLAG